MAPREQTSRDYAHPHRPLALRIFNALGRVKPFDLESIIASAKRDTGLEHFAYDGFRPALTKLIDSIGETGKLTPTGRFMAAQHFAGGLKVNLRAGELFAQKPELRETELARPIMICGLARSGTTLLQRMLAQIPGARTIATYEAIEPIPQPPFGPGVKPEDDPRFHRAKQAERFVRWLSPDFFAVHALDALEPEEEILVIGNLFHSSLPESSYNVRSYSAWIENQDPAHAYRWLADSLRVLQWQRPGDFWVLKSPYHLDWLDTIFAEFPDITIVQTHRDPAEAVASFCSLVGHSHGIGSDEVDTAEIGRHWSRKYERWLNRSLATRDARDGAGFVDIDYRELIADPVAVVGRLCQTVGLPWDESIRLSLETWLSDNRQHKHGIHRYAAEDFGLEVGELRERYRGYSERFDLL